VQQVMILVEGTVDEIVGGVVVEHHEAGTLLGPDTALGDRPSSATLRARSRVVAVAVPVVDLGHLAGEPEVNAWLRDQDTEHLRRIQAAVDAPPDDGVVDNEGGPWRAPCQHSQHRMGG
jgi:hypothetical protein